MGQRGVAPSASRDAALASTTLRPPLTRSWLRKPWEGLCKGRRGAIPEGWAEGGALRAFGVEQRQGRPPRSVAKQRAAKRTLDAAKRPYALGHRGRLLSPAPVASRRVWGSPEGAMPLLVENRIGRLWRPPLGLFTPRAAWAVGGGYPPKIAASHGRRGFHGSRARFFNRFFRF
jgi:hypothetical protein